MMSDCTVMAYSRFSLKDVNIQLAREALKDLDEDSYPFKLRDFCRGFEEAPVAEQQSVLSPGEAMKKAVPATLNYSKARCGVAMNRRTPNGSGGWNNFPNPDGPVDHVVPVLKVAVPVLMSLLVIRLIARVLAAVFPNSRGARILEQVVSWLAWALAVLWMGVYPKPFTDTMQVSVTELLKHVAVSKLN